MAKSGAIYFCNGARDRKVTRSAEKFKWHRGMLNTIYI